MLAQGILTVCILYQDRPQIQCVEEPRKRQTSPFPSPKFSRRVLALSQLKEAQKPPLAPNRPLHRSSLSKTLNQSRESLDNDPLVNDAVDEMNDVMNTNGTVNGLGQLSISTRPLNRRDSVSAANGELFGSLVGSYEESILSGRMSTFPSKPITFLAEIGVIGLGKCKTSLKCPPHIILPFPAYFYELQDEESPTTPYVGTVEVDGTLTEPPSPMGPEMGYRLPFKGQLQIVNLIHLGD